MGISSAEDLEYPLSNPTIIIFVLQAYIDIIETRRFYE